MFDVRCSFVCFLDFCEETIFAGVQIGRDLRHVLRDIFLRVRELVRRRNQFTQVCQIDDDRQPSTVGGTMIF